MPSRTRCPKCGYGPVMSVAQAAADAGVTEQAVRAALGQGRFPGAIREAVPGGYRWWIPRVDVRAWKRARKGSRRKAA